MLKRLETAFTLSEDLENDEIKEVLANFLYTCLVKMYMNEKTRHMALEKISAKAGLLIDRHYDEPE